MARLDGHGVRPDDPVRASLRQRRTGNGGIIE